MLCQVLPKRPIGPKGGSATPTPSRHRDGQGREKYVLTSMIVPLFLIGRGAASVTRVRLSFAPQPTEPESAPP
jgi:hypothetical protein